MKRKNRWEAQGKWEEFQEVSEELIKLKKSIGFLGGVIASYMYSIEWLKTAKEPGAHREISNQSRC